MMSYHSLCAFLITVCEHKCQMYATGFLWIFDKICYMIYFFFRMSGEDELMGANVSQREDASDSSAQEGRLKDGRRHAKLEKALSRGR